MFYLITFVASWVFLALLLQRCDAKIGLRLPTIMRPLGLPVIAIGAFIGLTCVCRFVTRGRGTPVPFDPPREFVSTGFYRYVRNPMFIGFLLALFGFGMLRLSATILLLVVGAFFLAHCFVVFVEEPGLERRFGDSYRRYRKEVNRWLPTFRSRI